MEPQPQVSPDGQFWWDGQAWQPMPTLSPDGSHWWNGQAWLPVPVENEITAAVPVPAAAPRMQWTADEVGPYGISSAAFASPPAGFGPPAAYTVPIWRDEPPKPRQPRNVAGDIALWGGVTVGFLVLLFGGLFIVQVRATPWPQPDAIYVGVSIGVLVILVGTVICLASGMRLMGLSLWAPVRPVIVELGVFGTIWLLNLILTDILLLSSPPDFYPTYLPWGYGLMIGYKAWRNKWLAAGTLFFFWVITLLLQLPSHIGG
ncbi:MAG: hypothetical protein ACHQ0J_07240 [Candidatus Dormibacterales bacterium]